MAETLKIALAQINPTVGDLTGNRKKILDFWSRSASLGADLVVFPELALSGYPPEDLVLRSEFIDRTRETMEGLVRDMADGPATILTAPWKQDGRLYNSALLVGGGKITGIAHKTELPNYGVFDEKRLFSSPKDLSVFAFRGMRLGVPICEDIWYPDVVARLRDLGADILVVPNGSPFEHEKFDRRLSLTKERVRETGLPLVYLNQVGGQDELVFDGGSFVMNADRSRAVQLPRWEEDLCLTVWDPKGASWVCRSLPIQPEIEDEENVYRAMVVGLRDYVEKNRFPGVVLGMSGGIDSALSAAVAVDALGPDRVLCVRLPSRFTSHESMDDASDCAALLGCRIETVSIMETVDSSEKTLANLFQGKNPDTTEENLQARTRGLLLMALSNKLGHLLLTTGNKSEMSVGYATLYGDMCGGYSVLKDLYKTWVYRLSRWRNIARPPGVQGPSGRVIPENIIVKPPTAELRPGQTDQDTLPPYEDLDRILEMLVEDEVPVDNIVSAGFDRDLVLRIIRMLRLAEYKRRQAPPGVKITRRAFGRDRRYPITNAFHEGVRH